MDTSQEEDSAPSSFMTNLAQEETSTPLPVAVDPAVVWEEIDRLCQPKKDWFGRIKTGNGKETELWLCKQLKTLKSNLDKPVPKVPGPVDPDVGVFLSYQQDQSGPDVATRHSEAFAALGQDHPSNRCGTRGSVSLVLSLNASTIPCVLTGLSEDFATTAKAILSRVYLGASEETSLPGLVGHFTQCKETVIFKEMLNLASTCMAFGKEEEDIDKLARSFVSHGVLTSWNVNMMKGKSRKRPRDSQGEAEDSSKVPRGEDTADIESDSGRGRGLSGGASTSATPRGRSGGGGLGRGGSMEDIVVSPEDGGGGRGLSRGASTSATPRGRSGGGGLDRDDCSRDGIRGGGDEDFPMRTWDEKGKAKATGPDGSDGSEGEDDDDNDGGEGEGEGDYYSHNHDEDDVDGDHDDDDDDDGGGVGGGGNDDDNNEDVDGEGQGTCNGNAQGNDGKKKSPKVKDARSTRFSVLINNYKTVADVCEGLFSLQNGVLSSIKTGFSRPFMMALQDVKKNFLNNLDSYIKKSHGDLSKFDESKNSALIF